jgi:hypothetical protein
MIETVELECTSKLFLYNGTLTCYLRYFLEPDALQVSFNSTLQDYEYGVLLTNKSPFLGKTFSIFWDFVLI